jgi:hypothetical protein
MGIGRFSFFPSIKREKAKWRISGLVSLFARPARRANGAGLRRMGKTIRLVLYISAVATAASLGTKKAGASFDEAEASRFRLERKLKAQSQGFLVPEETVDPKKSHRISDVITAYLAASRLNRRPVKSIKSKKFELEQFAQFCGKTYVEDIRHADLIAYRNHHLLDAGKATVTALNN